MRRGSTTTSTSNSVSAKTPTRTPASRATSPRCSTRRIPSPTSRRVPSTPSPAPRAARQDRTRHRRARAHRAETPTTVPTTFHPSPRVEAHLPRSIGCETSCRDPVLPPSSTRLTAPTAQHLGRQRRRQLRRGFHHPSPLARRLERRVHLPLGEDRTASLSPGEPTCEKCGHQRRVRGERLRVRTPVWRRPRMQDDAFARRSRAWRRLRVQTRIPRRDPDDARERPDTIEIHENPRRTFGDEARSENSRRRPAGVFPRKIPSMSRLVREVRGGRRGRVASHRDVRRGD